MNLKNCIEMNFRLNQTTKDMLLQHFNSKKELYINSRIDKMKNPLINVCKGLEVIINNNEDAYITQEKYVLKDPRPYYKDNDYLIFVREKDFDNYWMKVEPAEETKKKIEDKFNSDYPVGSLISFKNKDTGDWNKNFGYIVKKSIIIYENNEVHLTIDLINYNGRVRNSFVSYYLNLDDTEFSIVTIDDVYKFLDDGFIKRIKSNKEQIKQAHKNIINEQKERYKLKKNLKITVEEQLNEQ